MSDSYQAIYDAVRSRISGGNISDAVESAVSNSGIGFAAEMVRNAWQVAAVTLEHEQSRPSVLYRPALYPDGNMWCALYGENLQDGLAGFGKTPSEAMADFDTRWREQQLRGSQP